MRPVRSQTLPLSEELEKKREHLVDAIYDLAIAFDEYFTVQDLCKKYDGIYAVPLVTKVKQLGYNSVYQVLTSSGYFLTAILKSQKHYRADPQRGSKATQEISSLVKRQAKKKKAKAPKVDTSTRQYFHRASPRSHSFHGRPTAFGAGLIHNQKNILPKVPQRMLQRLSVEQCSSTTSSSVKSNVPVAHKAPAQRLHYKFGKSPSTPPQKTLTPAIGAERFVAALRKCGGSATEEQLEKAYRSLYHTDLSDVELSRCFGQTSIRDIVNTYLHDIVEITSMRGHGTRRYKLVVESKSLPVPPKPLTVCELCSRLIEIMLDGESKLVNLSSIEKLYKQKYNVEFTVEDRLILERVLARSHSTIYIDSSGYLRLNHEDIDVKRIMTERLVQASLDADTDSDSLESSTSSSSDRYMGNLEALSALRITIPGSSQPTSKDVNEERSSRLYPVDNPTSTQRSTEKSTSLPERLPSSLSTMSSSSGSRLRLGEEFASIRKIFQEEVIKEDFEAYSYILAHHSDGGRV